MLSTEYFITTKKNWRVWEEKAFRSKLIAWFLVVAALLTFLPFFFQFIQVRDGVHLNDPFLKILPARDFSIPIFLVIWSCALLLLISMIRDARILLNFMAAYSLLTLFRLITIYFLPMEPPENLIALKDPLSNSFYGVSFITKDLFFSGHTSTLFLIFLSLGNRKFRVFSLIGTCLVGFLLLLQHVHYTIDVIFAFPFAYITYLLAKRIT